MESDVKHEVVRIYKDTGKNLSGQKNPINRISHGPSPVTPRWGAGERKPVTESLDKCLVRSYTLFRQLLHSLPSDRRSTHLYSAHTHTLNALHPDLLTHHHVNYHLPPLLIFAHIHIANRTHAHSSRPRPHTSVHMPQSCLVGVGLLRVRIFADCLLDSHCARRRPAHLPPRAQSWSRERAGPKTDEKWST